MTKQLPDLEYLFHPDSIAIVGATTTQEAGGTFLSSLIEFGYKGNLYPVNPKASEIMGLKVYPTLLSVPQSVGYVICTIPAAQTPKLMKECIAKGVKAISLYTAGFSEASEEGRKLEQELVALARQAGIRIIGPNCMGIYCPSTALSYNKGFSREAGEVGLLCQSGGNSLELVMMGNSRGIRFSKVISYGNAADLNEADFLEYFTQDNETKIIGIYIEGVKEGERFFKVLREAASTKPVIILKGGRTEVGTKTAFSHTGALTGNKQIWGTAIRQARALPVYSLEEMIDLMVMCVYMSPPQGRRVGIVGVSGGASVLITDECESVGLKVPPLPDRVKQEIRKFTPKAGTNVNNPVDTLPHIWWDTVKLSQTIELVASSQEIDLLLTHISLAHYLYRWEYRTRESLETIIKVSKAINKPMVIVIRNSDIPGASPIFSQLQQRCLEEGLPVYPSISRAASSISKFIHYLEEKA